MGRDFAGAVRASHAARIDLTRLLGDARPGRAATLSPRLSGQALRIRLPGDRGIRSLQIDTVYESLPEVFVYTGKVAGEDDSMFTLAVDGDDLTGKIYLGERTFLIERSAQSASVYELDRSLIPLPAEEHYGEVVDGAVEAPATAGDVGVLSHHDGNVRVLVLHTPAVAARNNVNTLASAIMAEFNTSLAQSGVPTSNYVSLSGLQLIPDNFAGLCNNDIWREVRNRTGHFEGLNDQMKLWGADIAVVLVTTEPGYAHCHGGLGRIGGIAGGQLEATQPFVVQTDTYALGDLTALHEIGHVLGGKHEVYQAGECPNGLCQADARGRVNPQQWQTVMGGYVRNCPFNTACVRIPRWSNPNVNWGGVATGVVDVSNMARALPIGMPLVAEWQSSPVPPAAPNPLSAVSERCYGLNSVYWGSQSAAAEYRLFRSTSSSFSNPVLVYSGQANEALVNVSSGTWYLRAQACNGGGCSAFTNTVTAKYTSSCL